MTQAPTLVCFAVKEEARHFKRLVYGCPFTRILMTGMGKRNALRTVGQAFVQHRPQCVITAGFAGGLISELPHGTVVFSADEGMALEPALREAGARPAHFYCADRVITTAAQKRELHLRTGAEIVEMESRFIRELCREQKIPAATVRVVLDIASEDLVLDFNELMTADQKLAAGKLALALLRSPLKIGAMIRLQKQSVAAAKRLGEVLGHALKLENGSKR
jgi:nucleoside phosphorylase